MSPVVYNGAARINYSGERLLFVGFLFIGSVFDRYFDEPGRPLDGTISDGPGRDKGVGRSSVRRNYLRAIDECHDRLAGSQDGHVPTVVQELVCPGFFRASSIWTVLHKLEQHKKLHFLIWYRSEEALVQVEEQRIKFGECDEKDT